MNQPSRVHPSAFIGEGVELGEDVSIGPNAVLLGPCVVGDGVWIGSGASVGAPPEITDAPQNLAWDGELDHAGVVIESGAVIREQVVIHQGTHRPTTVGTGAWLLNRVYLAHDVVVGAGATVSAGVSIGGHCTLGRGVNLGMNASVHQRRVIGAGAMIGMGTPLTRDVPPFGKAYGSPAKLRGVNSIGMLRQGYDEADVAALVSAYQSGDIMLESLDGVSPMLSEAVRAWREASPAKPFAELSVL